MNKFQNIQSRIDRTNEKIRDNLNKNKVLREERAFLASQLRDEKKADKARQKAEDEKSTEPKPVRARKPRTATLVTADQGYAHDPVF